MLDMVSMKIVSAPAGLTGVTVTLKHGSSPPHHRRIPSPKERAQHPRLSHFVEIVEDHSGHQQRCEPHLLRNLNPRHAGLDQINRLSGIFGLHLDRNADQSLKFAQILHRNELIICRGIAPFLCAPNRTLCTIPRTASRKVDDSFLSGVECMYGLVAHLTCFHV